MKFAVMSDSHDQLDRLGQAIAIAGQRKCQWIFHLGDIVSPFTVDKFRGFSGQIRAVFGNNDGEILGLQRAFNQAGGEISTGPVRLVLEEKRIALMHEPWLLDELASSQGFDFIFYGHLHAVDCRKEGKTLILNPGDLSGWTAPSTFFICDSLTGDLEKISL